MALTAAAAATRRLKLGTGICLVVERDPIVTAKAVATVDRLSGGRFLFGIGGGWNAEEMENHGTAFKMRWRLLRERVLAMKEIWTKREAEFHGEFVNFDKIWADPKPLQKPHPPIIIGGDGATTFDRVVEFGDGWMPIIPTEQEPDRTDPGAAPATGESGPRSEVRAGVTVFRAAQAAGAGGACGGRRRARDLRPAIRAARGVPAAPRRLCGGDASREPGERSGGNAIISSGHARSSARSLPRARRVKTNHGNRNSAQNEDLRKYCFTLWRTFPTCSLIHKIGQGTSAVSVEFSRDPNERLMYVMNQNHREVDVFDREAGKLLWTIGKGTDLFFPGQIFDGIHAAVDSKGNVYVAEDEGRRLLRFKMLGNEGSTSRIPEAR